MARTEVNTGDGVGDDQARDAFVILIILKVNAFSPCFKNKVEACELQLDGKGRNVSNKVCTGIIALCSIHCALCTGIIGALCTGIIALCSMHWHK